MEFLYLVGIVTFHFNFIYGILFLEVCMIIGVGTDIIEIHRIAQAISKGSFLEKSFTEYERQYYICKGSKAETLAGIFAAKEAVAKSMGTGFRGFELKDVEIIHGTLGEPKVILGKKAMEVAKFKGISDFKLSISHDKSSAIAYVIAI